MMTFIPPIRKLIELLILFIILGVFYLIYPDLSIVILFTFGFIWNWTASNDLSVLFLNKRYRFSLIKFVVTCQQLILRPFSWAPEILKKVVKILPAGLFWTLIIFWNESFMPWWATFIGSLVFELTQLDFSFLNKKETKLEEQR